MKNSEKLSEAIGGIDDKMIEEAYGRQAEKKRVFSVIGKIASVAAIVALAVFAVVLSLYAKKDSNISASNGESESTSIEDNKSGENLLYEKDFDKFHEHNLGFTSDDGTLEYELKLILPADENFFFKCYAKVINKTDSDIQLHKIADHNSFFYLENILKSAEYEQTFVYNGNAKTDTVSLKPGGSYEELLTYKDGVKAYMKSDYVQNVHDVSGYLTVTVNLDPEMSRTWGKSFTWFEGSYYKNNGKTVEVGEDDYGCFICSDQKVKGLEGFVCDSYDDPISGQHVEVDGSGISEELKSMENPPTLHYKTGDTIDYIIDPALSFNGFQLWYVNAYNTIDFGGDLYKYLDANPGQYYITAEQYKGGRHTTMGVKLIVESRTDEIVFMTAAELGLVSKIHVTSLPEGYDYSFEGEGVKPITDYLASLHPVSIDDNDGYMVGMTWVIELTYADGTVKEIYHIGNTYIYKSDGNKKYYKLTYEEANRFNSVIGSGENRTEDAEIELVNISQIREINGYSYFESEAEDEWKSAVSGLKLRDVRKIISVAQCMPSLLPKDYLVWNIGMEGSVYSAENAHSISCTFIDGIDTDQDGNLINNGTYSSLSIFLYKKEAYEGSEYISKLADKYQIKGVLSADSIYEKYSVSENGCRFMIETDTYYVLYEYRGYEGGKRNLSSKNLYEIAASAPYIKENGYTPTEITGAETEENETGIVYMTQKELEGVTKIRVTDWTEKKAYEIEGAGVKKITDHLASMRMTNPGADGPFLAVMSGLNIELIYGDGTVKEFYVVRFAGIYDYDDKMIRCAANSDDIKRLDNIIKDTEGKKDISDTVINTQDDEKIKEKFLSLLKANGTTDGTSYHKQGGIKSIDKYSVVHYYLLERQIPGAYIIAENTKIFIMVNDMIFTPVGGGYDTWLIDTCDYNNDGVTDIRVSVSGGSGTSYTYGYTIDLTEMKIVNSNSNNPYYNFHFDDTTEVSE